MRCLCSIFKRTMLSHVLGILPQETILQIETGRQRDPKESWREETHGSFYTQGFLHRETFTQRSFFYTQKVLPREIFTLRSFCAQTFWSFYTETVTQRSLYTESCNAQTRLHAETFTQRNLCTESFYTRKPLHTEKSLHIRAFTQRNFHTQKETFTQRSLYTEWFLQKLLHTKAFTQRRLCTEAPLHEVTN